MVAEETVRTCKFVQVGVQCSAARMRHLHVTAWYDPGGRETTHAVAAHPLMCLRGTARESTSRHLVTWISEA